MFPLGLLFGINLVLMMSGNVTEGDNLSNGGEAPATPSVIQISCFQRLKQHLEDNLDIGSLNASRPVATLQLLP